jgi:hypothetical protein
MGDDERDAETRKRPQIDGLQGGMNQRINAAASLSLGLAGHRSRIEIRCCAVLLWKVCRL